MGKSKKQVAVVVESIDIAIKKKGKRSAGKENVGKPSKKLKATGKSKEPAEEFEMLEAEELAGSPPKAIKKAAASLKNGSGKKSKKAGLVSKTQAPQTVPAKTGKKAPKEESDDTSDSETEPAKPPPKNLRKAVTKNGVEVTKQESSSEDSDDDSSKEEDTHKAVPAKAVAKAPPKKMESSSEEDSDDSDEEDKPVQKKTAMSGKLNVKGPAKKLESSDEEEDSDDSDEEDDPIPVASRNAKGKPPAKKVEGSSDEDESDESKELDAKEEKLISKTAASDDSDASEDEDEDEDESEGESEDDKVEAKIKSSKKGQAQPKTPALRTEGGGSKTVFIKNLAWGVDEDILQSFFESVGEVQEVRLSRNEDGRSRGFGHVDFTSMEAAKKACEKSGEVLEGRDVFIELARERLFSPGSEGKRDFNSPRGGGFSGGRGQRSSSDSTAFVRGFNKFQDEDSIRNSLTEFFGECGVQNIRLPTDRETGDIKGFAYVDFSDKDGLAKAIDCSGSDLDGRSLFIEEAGGGGPSGGGRGRGGGDFGGRGGGGGFGGRGGRGRGNFGDRGRGGGRRGGRGFGGSKASLSGSGKKTTFGDD